MQRTCGKDNLRKDNFRAPPSGLQPGKHTVERESSAPAPVAREPCALSLCTAPPINVLLSTGQASFRVRLDGRVDGIVEAHIVAEHLGAKELPSEVRG